MRKTIIFVDNVIGGGKTTLISQLTTIHPEWEIIQEGVDFDIFKSGLSIKSQEDLFMAQVYFNYSKALKGSSAILIADRTYDSVYRWAFATNQKTTRLMNDLTAKIKNELEYVNKLCIYIEDNDMETTLENIQSRGRDFEQHYTKKTLQKLKRGYNRHFPGFKIDGYITLVANKVNYEYFPILAETFILNNLPP